MARLIGTRPRNLKRRAQPQPELFAVFLCPDKTPSYLWSGVSLNTRPVFPEISGAAPFAVSSLPITHLDDCNSREKKETYHV